MSEAFGHKVCDVPTYEHIWVDWKQSGYPRKLRRELSGMTADETLVTVLGYVTAWGMTDITGASVAHSADPACLDMAEDAVVAWLVRAFVQFWLAELTLPRPNSSPPLPAT